MIWLMLVTQLVIMPSTPKDSICMERGHICPDNIATSGTSFSVSNPLLPNHVEYVDLQNKTIKVAYFIKTKEYTCQRCGEWIVEKDTILIDTTIIWQKGD